MSNDQDSVVFGTITGIVEFVPGMTVPLTGMTSVVVLFVDETFSEITVNSADPLDLISSAESVYEEDDG